MCRRWWCRSWWSTRSGCRSIVFEVEWLEELLEVPADAVWPRLMSAPHRDAVGSFGGEFEGWCRAEYGFKLRWFQRLVVYRLLEHDALFRLCWQVALLTVARQVGKTVLAHMLLDWRSEQQARFGEHQLVLHTANVMRSAVRGLDFATDRAARHGWKRTYAAGNEGIDKRARGVAGQVASVDGRVHGVDGVRR